MAAAAGTNAKQITATMIAMSKTAQPDKIKKGTEQLYKKDVPIAANAQLDRYVDGRAKLLQRELRGCRMMEIR